MTLPSFLLAEIRLTFSLCAKQHAATRRYPFSTTSIALKKQPKTNSSPSSRSPISSPRQPSLSHRSPAQDVSQASRPEAKDLVPRDKEAGSLDRHRKVDVPMKVLPEAQVSPKHKLSPTQRLHIEHLTRHPPKQAPPKGKRGRPQEQQS